MKASVNQEGCIGCELCVSMCEAVFSMTEEGVAEAVTSDIPKDEEDASMDAAEACPVDVITIK